MPSFDKNQNSPTNWKMTKKNPRASCKMNGSAENSVEGTKNSEDAGETWKNAPRRNANTTSTNSTRRTREIRYRFQSDAARND